MQTSLTHWPLEPLYWQPLPLPSCWLPILVNAAGHLLISVSGVSSATNTKVAVGAASTTALAANASRKFAHFVNDSDEAIYLNFSGTAVINEGARLNARGGYCGINMTDLYTGIVTAICASGGKNLTVMEG